MFKKENYKEITEKKISKENLSNKNKVDINILLNRVRADKKKEKIESIIFIGFISIAVIAAGVIISFR